MTLLSSARAPEQVDQRRGVLIVDDHRTFGELLRLALSSEADLDCLEVATSLQSVVELVQRLRPDVVVMDVHFDSESGDGITATAQITAAAPWARVVLLTGAPDRDVLRRAASAGACSVIAKDGSLPDLLAAIRSARPGGLVVAPEMLRHLLLEAPVAERPLPVLTPRESDVLAMLELGIDTRTIADQLGISVNTYRGYVKTLLSKLHAHSQLEAVAIARSMGLFGAGTDRQG